MSSLKEDVWDLLGGVHAKADAYTELIETETTGLDSTTRKYLQGKIDGLNSASEMIHQVISMTNESQAIKDLFDYKD